MVFCTSRGRDLDLHIKPKGETVVFCLSGWKILAIKEEAKNEINYYRRKYRTIHCYFLVGVPDITQRVKGDGYEDVTMGDMEQCVENISERLLDLTETIKSLKCKVCVCTVAPMDIEKWNRHRLNSKKTSSLNYLQEYSTMQKSLEKAIIQINKFIIEINLTNKMIIPFIADTVMTKKGSRNKKFYEKLPDGLHAGDELKKQWGELIAKRIDQNFSMSNGVECVQQQNYTPPAEDHPTWDCSPNKKRGWRTY